MNKTIGAKERIEKYKKYIIRRIPGSKWIIALPSNVGGIMHRLESYETEDEAFERVKEVINEKT